ncbi:MAG TPA: hypothetical protein VJV78_13020 [Polyangiales bacterium]|nr:hypothetical protein [Polyangiales bacterium]
MKRTWRTMGFGVALGWLAACTGDERAPAPAAPVAENSTPTAAAPSTPTEPALTPLGPSAGAAGQSAMAAAPGPKPQPPASPAAASGGGAALPANVCQVLAPRRPQNRSHQLRPRPAPRTRPVCQVCHDPGLGCVCLVA